MYFPLVLVIEFLEKGEPLVVPDGFPQTKELIEEQLKVLKSLHIGSVKNNSAVVASGSKIQSSGDTKRKEKATSFVPNIQQNKIRNSGDRLTMLEKLEIAAPYHLFFTRIPESPETLKQANSVTITGWLGVRKSEQKMFFLL